MRSRALFEMLLIKTKKNKKIKTLCNYFWSVLEKERVKQKVSPPCVSRLFTATSPPTSTESKTMPLFPSSAPVRPPLPRLFYLHPSNVELHPCISQLLARVPAARQTDDETATKSSRLSLPARASRRLLGWFCITKPPGGLV